MNPDSAVWLDEVRHHLRLHRQVLFGKDMPFLQELSSLLAAQTRRVQVLWALELADDSAAVLAERYPDKAQPQDAVSAARLWAAGAIKMRPAQRAILDCHALAKELRDEADIALCHAVGQACAVVHAPGHAIGYPMYDLTSVVRRLGADACACAVERRMQHYLDRLAFWGASPEQHSGNWASFLSRPAADSICK